MMSKKSQATPETGTLAGPKYRFDLVVGYEDVPTRNRALSLYDRLARRLLDEYDFQCAWWKFDHLRADSLMAQAIGDAAKANMIILSLGAGNQLPPVGQSWIEAWASHKSRRKSALVALIDVPRQPAPGACQVQSYLEQIAQRAKMDFFFHAAEAAKEGPLYTAETLVKRAQTVTPLLQEILKYRISAPRLGLN